MRSGVVTVLDVAGAMRRVPSSRNMASAHATFTGEVGVCLATSSPGAVHLLNGLYDAKLDHQPVVAIVGQQARTSLGSRYQQEIDLQSLFKDVASRYITTVTHPAGGEARDRSGDADRQGGSRGHLCDRAE